MEIYKAPTGCIVYLDPDEETMERFDKVAQGCRGFLSANDRGSAGRSPRLQREGQPKTLWPAEESLEVTLDEPGSEPGPPVTTN